jgi:hypothetical protein
MEKVEFESYFHAKSIFHNFLIKFYLQINQKLTLFITDF